MITKREWEKASHAFYPELLRDPRLARYAENLKNKSALWQIFLTQ